MSSLSAACKRVKRVLTDPRLTGRTRTSTPVSEQVAVDVLDVGVDGGSAGNASWGHVGVSLRVDVLQALPWYSGAEF